MQLELEDTMSGYNYVSQISLGPGDPTWMEWRKIAAVWLDKNVGDYNWEQVDVELSEPVTVAFREKKYKRMFDLWTEMNGVPAVSPTKIRMAGGDTGCITVEVNV